MACLKPQNLDKDNWYYEYPTYLLLVQRRYDETGRYCGTEALKIQWRKLKQSLERSYRPSNRKKRR